MFFAPLMRIWAYAPVSDGLCTNTFSLAATGKISVNKGCEKSHFKTVQAFGALGGSDYTGEAAWSHFMFHSLVFFPSTLFYCQAPEMFCCLTWRSLGTLGEQVMQDFISFHLILHHQLCSIFSEYHLNINVIKMWEFIEHYYQDSSNRNIMCMNHAAWLYRAHSVWSLSFTSLHHCVPQANSSPFCHPIHKPLTGGQFSTLHLCWPLQTIVWQMPSQQGWCVLNQASESPWGSCRLQTPSRLSLEAQPAQPALLPALDCSILLQHHCSILSRRVR